MHLGSGGKSPFRYKRLFRYIRLGYNGSFVISGLFITGVYCSHLYNIIFLSIVNPNIIQNTK